MADLEGDNSKGLSGECDFILSKGEQKTESDIDILVSFSKPIGMEFISLSLEIEKMFTQKVDIVSLNGIKSSYWNEIKCEIIYV